MTSKFGVTCVRYGLLLSCWISPDFLIMVIQFTSWKWFHPDIRKFIIDDGVVNSMNGSEIHVWTSFVDALKQFFRRGENYKKFVEKLFGIVANHLFWVI